MLGTSGSDSPSHVDHLSFADTPTEVGAANGQLLGDVTSLDTMLTSDGDSTQHLPDVAPYDAGFAATSPHPDSDAVSHTIGELVTTDNGPTSVPLLTAMSTNTFDVAPSIAVVPSSPHADAPTMAFIGDLGDGLGQIATASSGTGTGTGGSGTTLQNTTSSSSGFVINVVWDSSVANAPAGFITTVDQVVSYFESQFSNPITITLDVGYGEVAGQPLGSGALGESETALTSVSYSALEAALVKNANAIGNTAAAASIPTTSPVSGTWWVSTAEAQALGLSSISGGPDGYVGFSATASFCYNDANGVPSGQYDFFGVVAHEISEVMGRQMMDGESFAGGTGYEPLDLFHYSAPGVRDFSGTTAGYFSANGGTTNLGNFNTNPGGDFGDWAASVAITRSLHSPIPE